MGLCLCEAVFMNAIPRKARRGSQSPVELALEAVVNCRHSAGKHWFGSLASTVGILSHPSSVPLSFKTSKQMNDFACAFVALGPLPPATS